MPTGKNTSKTSLKLGTVPRITVTSQNNGIYDFYKNDNLRFSENFISVSFLGDVFYHPYKASLDMKVHCFKLKNKKLNLFLALFLAVVIRQNTLQYNYGNQLSSTDAPSKKIYIPITSTGKIDYDFMENYIKSLMTQKRQQYIDYVTKYMATTPPLHLYSSLQNTKWKEFYISKVFTIEATVSGIDKNKLNQKVGDYPYITRSYLNNGISNFIAEQNKYNFNYGNCITIGLDTQTVFYQLHDFYTGQNIQILRNEKLNETNSIFLIPLLKNTVSIFNWGGNGATLSRLKRSKILLPVTSNNEIDYNFMENYIKCTTVQKYKQYMEYINKT